MVDQQSLLVKDPVPYFKETLSLPQDQPLPKDHVELLEIVLAGDMGSGKSFFIDNELYPIALSMWSNQDEQGNILYNHKKDRIDQYIDFFEAKDISGTIQAVQKSDKYVHFIKIDDAVKRGTDSRRSMTTKNVTGTQKFFVIRHLAKEGVLGAGFIILIFATQDLDAIDKRIRNHAGMFILKSYVSGCEEWIFDPEIIDRLFILSDNARRRHRNDIRRIAIAVDVRGKCHQILTTSKRFKGYHRFLKDGTLEYKKADYISVEAGTTFKKHLNELVDYAYHKYKKFKKEDIKLTVSDLKGMLFTKLEEMETTYRFCEVTDSNFTEAIWIAKSRYKRDLLENKKEKEQKQREIQTERNRIRNIQTNQLAVFGYKTLQKYEDHEIKLTKSELQLRMRQHLKKIKDCILDDDDIHNAIDIAKACLTDMILREKMRKDRYIEKHQIDPNEDLTQFEIIHNVMKAEKVADISLISKRTGLQSNQISRTLSTHKDIFVNVVKNRGVWKLKGYEHTQIELQKFLPEQPKRKVLEM